MQKQENTNLINVNEIREMNNLTIDQIHEKMKDTNLETLKRIDEGKRKQIASAEYRVICDVREEGRDSGIYKMHLNAVTNYYKAVQTRRLVYGALLVTDNEANKKGMSMKDVQAEVNKKYPNRLGELISGKIEKIKAANAKKAQKAPAKEEVKVQNEPATIAIQY